MRLIGLPWGEHVPDGRLFVIALVALCLVVFWLALATWRHRRNLRAVPVRIHVAGTRGKSTTTRLIAAGLRAGGRRVLAKTTGSEPRLMLPDGSEQPWSRRGPASIREQAKLFAHTARLGVDAVVVECMAIRPEMVWASERHLVQATTAVITNARADHFEDLGLASNATADALRWVTPKAGTLFVAAEAASADLRAFAAARGTALTIVDAENSDPLQADRALALAVCAAHGVPAEIAAPAMDAAAADPGGFFARDLSVDGKRVRFVNAFACNDVESLVLLWQTVDNAHPPVVVLNARPDRPLRSARFLSFLAKQAPTAALFVVGDPLALRLARRAGFAHDVARRLCARTPAQALVELAELAPAGGVIWGVGNYQGFGARLIAEIAKNGATC